MGKKMNVKREDKYLNMFIGQEFSNVYGMPLRTVIDYESVRKYLDKHLASAEDELGVDNSITRIMPYVLVLGTVDSIQEIIPICVNKGFFDTTIDLIENIDIEFEDDPVRGKWIKYAFIECLMEYNLNGAGLMHNGLPKGIIFSEDKSNNGDIKIDITGEHYGPYTSSRSNLFFSGDINELYDGRDNLDRKTSNMVAGMTPRNIVTLGPDDDISGIICGKFDYDNGWVRK